MIFCQKKIMLVINVIYFNLVYFLCFDTSLKILSRMYFRGFEDYVAPLATFPIPTSATESATESATMLPTTTTTTVTTTATTVETTATTTKLTTKYLIFSGYDYGNIFFKIFLFLLFVLLLFL